MTFRVLIADDEQRIHDAYRDCFRAKSKADAELENLGYELFGDAENQVESSGAANDGFEDYVFEHVTQGLDAVEKVRSAQEQKEPFALVYLDMRMPPGIDGYETARRIRASDPEINIVVVTGYSDHSPAKIAQVAGPPDKLYYLSKPFRTADIQQLTRSVCSKWCLERKLVQTRNNLSRKVVELEEANIRISASEAKTRHLALHDQLTKLPNRLHLVDHLKERITNGDSGFSILMLDLDNFKAVNDMLGHKAGDELVRQIAGRLRKASPDGAFMARLAGDEFAIVLSQRADEALEEAARALILACRRPLEIMGSSLFVGVSVGIAKHIPKDQTGSTLMRHADLALDSAKQTGRGSFRWFNAALEERNKLRARIEKRLRIALNEGLLSLSYQPIVHPDTGLPYGYEALVRWDDEVLGKMPPSLFVPIAEQCGMAKQLGEWVIREALSKAAAWDDGVVSINISTHHFQSSDLVHFVKKTAKSFDIPLERIQFEITETAMFAYPEQAAQIIVELRRAGIRIALDDFGTGYSSLVNIRDFEIDCIKIDKSFVDDIGTNSQTTAIVSAISAMAKLLGLNVVAEGVETDLQVQALRALGCGLMQGFYYSKAIQADDLPYAGIDDTDAAHRERRAG